MPVDVLLLEIYFVLGSIYMTPGTLLGGKDIMRPAHAGVPISLHTRVQNNYEQGCRSKSIPNNS